MEGQDYDKQKFVLIVSWICRSCKTHFPVERILEHSNIVHNSLAVHTDNCWNDDERIFREVKIPHVCQSCNQVIPDVGEAGTTAESTKPEPIAHFS
ncbi:unnamed protein product, partial [Allacma fusca]